MNRATTRLLLAGISFVVIFTAASFAIAHLLATGAVR